MTHAGTIEVRRRLPAPIGEVFRWWTEPGWGAMIDRLGGRLAPMPRVPHVR